jgi:mono/diheme cytochrome c family protein
MRTSLLFAILVFALTTAQSGTGAAQGGAPPAAGDPANGKAVFAFGNTSCTNCHGLEGQGGWGPDLAGRRITYDQAVAAIRNPIWRMPAFVPSQLSDKEIQDMVAYWNTLPVAPAIGKWRNEAPADGPRAQQLAVNIIGCGQCHGLTMSTPRHGAAGMSADFEWFKKQVYNHATVMPEQWKQLDGEGPPTTRGRVRMGNFYPKRLPESQLQEIWTWMNDLGMVVPIVARLTSGATSATGTVYTLSVENEGLKDKGVAAEDVTISLILPPGTKAASATGTGYQGTKRDEKASADVAVWRLPKLVAHEHQDFTITVAGTPAGDAVPRGTVAYAKPTAKADAVVNFALQRPGGRGRGGAQ